MSIFNNLVNYEDDIRDEVALLQVSLSFLTQETLIFESHQPYPGLHKMCLHFSKFRRFGKLHQDFQISPIDHIKRVRIEV